MFIFYFSVLVVIVTVATAGEGRRYTIVTLAEQNNKWVIPVCSVQTA